MATAEVKSADNVKSPLKIPELLVQFLKFLDLKDIKSCRLVNSLWKNVANDRVKELAGNMKPISVGREKFNSVTEFTQLIHYMTISGPNFPCRKFEVYVSLLKDNLDCEFLLAEFFRELSGIVTELSLMYKTNDETFTTLMPRKWGFPLLKMLDLHGDMYPRHDLSQSGLIQFVANILEKAPNLEQLYFPLSYAPFSRWIGATVNDRLRHLTRLRITLPNEDATLKMWTSLGWRLKTLWLCIRETRASGDSLKKFLESQSATLESLRITDFTHGFALTVNFPCMGNLEDLAVEGGCALGPNRVMFMNVDYPAQFPKLRKLCFLESRNNWRDFLLTFCGPQGILDAIHLPQDYPFLEDAVRMFPCLNKVEIPTKIFIINEILAHLPTVEELTLDTSGLEVIDHIVLGVTKREFDKFVSRGRPDDHMRMGSITKPLNCLRRLKLLRLKSCEDCCTLKRFELTSVACSKVLLQMDSLQCLDICGRDPASQPKLSSAVLEQMKKKFKIV